MGSWSPLVPLCSSDRTTTSRKCFFFTTGLFKVVFTNDSLIISWFILCARSSPRTIDSACLVVYYLLLVTRLLLQPLSFRPKRFMYPVLYSTSLCDYSKAAFQRLLEASGIISESRDSNTAPGFHINFLVRLER